MALHLEADLFEVQHRTVLAKSFCLLSLKKKKCNNQLWLERKHSEYEGERKAYAANTLEGRKRWAWIVNAYLPTLVLLSHFPFSICPWDTKACWLLPVFCYKVRTRLSPVFPVNFSQFFPTDTALFLLTRFIPLYLFCRPSPHMAAQTKIGSFLFF